MPERQQVRQPHAREVIGQRRVGCAERREVAVRRREHDDIGRFLPEIAGDVAIVDSAAAVELQMHAFGSLLLPRQCTADGVAIKSLQTNYDEMLGLLNIRARESEFDTATYPLHHDRRGLVGDAGMPLDAQYASKVRAHC